MHPRMVRQVCSAEFSCGARASALACCRASWIGVSISCFRRELDKPESLDWLFVSAWDYLRLSRALGCHFCLVYDDF